MKLNEESFNKINNGLKSIEVRLYDDKRRSIDIGDEIIFSNLSNLNEKVSRRVSGLSIFKNFVELFENFDCKKFGHNNISVDDQIVRVRRFYSSEEEEKFGVVGIHLV